MGRTKSLLTMAIMMGMIAGDNKNVRTSPFDEKFLSLSLQFLKG